MSKRKTIKTIVLILTVSIVFFTINNLNEVNAKQYSFTATISPTQVTINQLATYLVIITNTGESSMGSANVAIPAGFAVLSPISILNPSTSWNYTLSDTLISVSADGGGSVLPPGGYISFTFDAIAPSYPGVNTWNSEATSSIYGGGVSLVLEGNQPTVTVIASQFFPPTISASPTTINKGQVSFLSQLTGASGGTPPYTYQWLEAFDGGVFSPIAGATGPDYVFSPTISTSTGLWSFQLNVTDSSSVPETLTSNTVNVVVNSALVAPVVTATPNEVTQTQTSTLAASPVTSGTSPYTYQWFQKAPGQDFIAVGSSSPSYIFPGSTTVGVWEFILEVNDSTGASVNSSTTIVTVSSTPSFTITVIQTVHGTISPGTMSVILGGNQAFTISPDTGHYIADVLVDGLSVGAVTSFNFVNVDADHSITAVFTEIEYTLAVSEIGDGSIILSPLQATYHYGDLVQLTAVPTSGWRFSVWTGDLTDSINPYTITIDGNKAVTAVFVLNQFTISASAGTGGSINPSGTVIVDYGGGQTYSITPNVGYHIVDVLINGTSLGPVSFCVVSDVTGDTEVSASFALDAVPIVASAGVGGSISPSGTVSVAFGNDQSFNISSDLGYYIADVLVDGFSVGAVSSYTFVSVTSNHTITASFAVNSGTFFIDVISSHGSPTTSAQVNASSNFSVSVTSPEGDASHRWICTGYSIDGGGLVSGTSYTFINVQADHVITFNWQEQYYVKVLSSDGSTTGTGWYNRGTTATVSVTSNTIVADSSTRQIFAGWTGGATGTDTTSEPITIDGPKTVTATWKIQYRVTYAASGNALQVNIPPSEWVDSGFSATGTFPTSTINSAGNTRGVLISDDRPLAINKPLTITGVYQTQYLVTFLQQGVEPDASGTIVTVFNDSKTYQQIPNGVWVNAGDSITFSFVNTVETSEAGKQYILTSTNSTSPLTVNGPIEIQGFYESQISSAGFNLDAIALAAIVAIPALVATPIVVRRRGRKKKINPITSEGGSISPSTVQTVDFGDDSTVFIITADSGYKIADVVIDNSVHLGVVRTHKFVNVKENHSISAVFVKD